MSTDDLLVDRWVGVDGYITEARDAAPLDLR